MDKCVSGAQLCPTLCDPKDCSLPGSCCPWNYPGKNTGVSCHFLLQGIFPSQGLKPGLQHCREILNQLSHQGRPLSWLNMTSNKMQRCPADPSLTMCPSWLSTCWPCQPRVTLGTPLDTLLGTTEHCYTDPTASHRSLHKFLMHPPISMARHSWLLRSPRKVWLACANVSSGW